MTKGETDWKRAFRDELVPERKDTGLRDRNRKPVFTGDIVEFQFNGTRMRDLVIEEDGTVYFVSGVLGGIGAFAWRYIDECEVIGSDPELLDT